MKKSSLAVVIVNWNGGDLLNVCLHHLLHQSLLPDQILVMDNGSSDDSAILAAQLPGVTVEFLGANLGFAAANNRALSLCNTEYIALLNPDAFPNPDWLERLLAAANFHPEIAAFASLQLSEGNPEVVDGAGDSYHVSGLVWRDRHGARFLPSDLQHKPIFTPCAAAALYRRDAVMDVGGFDEDFFCYVEDVDLGFRLSLAGYQAMLVGDAIVRHVGSAATGGQRSDFCVYHGHRNLVWAFIKNMPGILFWLLLPAHLMLNIFTMVYFVLNKQGKVIWLAKLDALKGVPKMWNKRREIQKKRNTSIANVWQVLNKRLWLSR